MKLINGSLVLLFLTATFTVNAQTHQNSNNHSQHQAAYKPLTEEVLKKRLENQLSFVKQRLAFDKKQADVYAQNFLRHQQQQIMSLKKMMQFAENQRQMSIKRLESQQQNLLDQFAKFQIAKDSKK